MFSWDKPASTKRFTGNRYSKQGVEYNIAREREREREVATMNQYVRQSTVSNQEAEQMKRAENARRRQSSLKLAGERQLEQQHRVIEAKEKRNDDRKKDLALARQLAAINKEQEKREREIQQICSQDPSLRELNEKIKAAYINRDRERQIQQQKDNEARIKAEQAQLEKDMEVQRRKGLEELEMRDARRRKFAEDQRVQINQQLKEQRANAQLQSILNYQKEKEQVEELIQSVYRQQREDAEEMEKQSQIMKQNMLEGLEIQRRRREQAKREEEEQERRIAAYKERVAHRNDAHNAEKAAKEAVQERIRQQIEEEMEARMAKEERMRDALHLLGKEEEEQRREAVAKAKREKADRMRREMMLANEEQMHYKVVVKEEERAVEDDILRRMQAKFEADEEAARRKEHRRRQAYSKYKKDVSAQMKERSDMYHAALRADAESNKAAKAQEEYKAQIIEEARKKILRAHAAQLQGYLPKGVLQKESDLEFLSPSSQRGHTR